MSEPGAVPLIVQPASAFAATSSGTRAGFAAAVICAAARMMSRANSPSADVSTQCPAVATYPSGFTPKPVQNAGPPTGLPPFTGCPFSSNT